MTTLDDGRVTLDAPLGEGGMGTVFRGRMRDHDGPVAVKLLRVEGVDPADRATLSSRLRDEAAAAARVVHPNLVRILASGDCPDHGPYIVYELVEGGSLEERLKAGPLPWEEVEEHLAPQLLGALGALHAAGIVHRDVKPDNIFVTPDGRYLLGDLGLAVFQGRSALTVTGVVVGTPGYLAPERVTAPEKPPTPAADVYAAAMVFVRAAGGRLPFTAAAPASLVREQLTKPVSSRALGVLGLPPGPARVLATALALDPSVRPSSAGELLVSLGEASREAEPARPAVTVALRASSRPRPEGSAEPVGSRPRLRLAAAVVVVLLLVLLLRLRALGPVPVDRADGAGGGELASLVDQVTASRPLLPDAAVDRLLLASSAPAPGADPRSLLRSVSLAAGTTSVAGLGARYLVEKPEEGALLAVTLEYAHLLRAAEPARAAGASSLLAALVGRTAGALRAPLDDATADEAEHLAVAVFIVLSGLPPSVRDGDRGRSLATAQEIFLAHTTPGGVPDYARQALALTLTDPALGSLRGTLAAALAVPAPPAASDAASHAAALEGQAEAALGRTRERWEALNRLVTDKLKAALNVSLGNTAALDEELRKAVAFVVPDWYLLVPTAAILPPPAPPASLPSAHNEAWSMTVSLLRRSKTMNERPALAAVATGPFRAAVLAARLGLGAVVLSERASRGDVVSRSLLARDAFELTNGLYERLGDDAAAFLDPVEASLAVAPACRPTLLALRGDRLYEAKRYAEARTLLVDAAQEALAVAEGAGSALRGTDLDVVRHTLNRLRHASLEGEDARRFEAARIRGRRLGQEAPRRTADGWEFVNAAAALVNETEQPLVREFVVE